MDTVAIIIQKLSGGGAERVAANLSFELSSSYDVKIIVFDASDATYQTGGELLDIKLPPRRSKLGQMINIVNRTIKVKRIKRKYNIKCSISLMEGANIVNILSKQRDRVIISERNLTSFFLKGAIAKIREKFITHKADKIVSLSELVRQDLIDNFNVPKEKVQTIYNSVDGDKLSNKPIQDEVFHFDQSVRYIVSIGRLTYQKGQWHLLKAFKYVKESLPNTKLLLLGEGELRAQLQQFACKLGLEKDVIFLGYCKNPHSIIKNADVFAFSSIVEGLGNVLLEAMACGLPVVSTDCDAGPREIIAPKTNPSTKTKTIEMADYGILTPVFGSSQFDDNDTVLSNEEKLLGDALLKVLQDTELRNHYANMSILRAKDFNPNEIKRQWDDLIQDLIAIND